MDGSLRGNFLSFCFIGFDKAIIPCSPYWTVGMPGTFKNRDAWCRLEKKHPAHSQNRASGLRKMEPRCFGTAKMPSLWCRKKPTVPRWIGAPALSTTKIPIFVGHDNDMTMDCSMPRWVKTWSGSRFAYMLCSLSWLSVLQPLVRSMRRTTWGLRFKSMWRGPQTCR